MHVPPWQISPAGQLPHWSTAPQPSLAVPHVRPSALQVVFAQLSQMCATPSQTAPGAQVPQSSAFPQPSLAGPHWNPSDAHDCMTHGPQAIPPPFETHVSPGGQVPQFTAVPHWLTTTPHVSPSCAHVFPGT